MKKALIVSFISISVLVAIKDPNVVIAQTVRDDVEICHRTHSTENPYSRITVSQSSIGTGPGQHGGKSHDDYSKRLFPDGKPYPNVFDSEMIYEPASEKLWGDIIPLKDINGKNLTGDAATVAGLNYEGAGIAIYEGTKGYEGLCPSLSTVTPSTTTTLVVAPSTSTTSTVTDSTTTTSTIVALTTPTTVPSTTTMAPTDLPETPVTSPTPQSATLLPALGKLKGHLWIDDNRNGTSDAEEEVVSQAIIEVAAAPGNTNKKTYYVQPNDFGNYLVENIDEGEWLVTASILLSGDFDHEQLNKSGTSKNTILKKVFIPVLGIAEADFAVVRTNSRKTATSPSNSDLQIDLLPNTGNGSARMFSLISVLFLLLGLVVVVLTKKKAVI